MFDGPERQVLGCDLRIAAVQRRNVGCSYAIRYPISPLRTEMRIDMDALWPTTLAWAVIPQSQWKATG